LKNDIIQWFSSSAYIALYLDMLSRGVHPPVKIKTSTGFSGKVSPERTSAHTISEKLYILQFF